MSVSQPRPKLGEIWWLEPDVTVGTEIQKGRPCLVVCSDTVGSLPVRLVAPVTEWKQEFNDKLWHVQLTPTKANGLAKTSSVDCLQLRGAAIQRFKYNMGRITADELKEIKLAIMAVIEAV